MRGLLPGLLLACTEMAPPDIAAAPPLTVDAHVEKQSGGGVKLVVQVQADEGISWTLADPAAEGITLGDRTERVERSAGRVVTTRSWPLTSKAPMATLQGVCAKSSGEPVCAPTLWLDFGAGIDRKGMVDIVEPDPVWTVPWVPVAAVGALALGAVGAALWLRRRPTQVIVPPVPEESPDVVALRRWEGIRADPSLDDHAKALGLSEVFRFYTEAVLQFPARASSTTEILARLERLTFLPRENLPRAKRLLRATDRVKYAEARPGTDFFDDLDGDLRAFIESTRPRAWTEPGADHG